jgi:CRISPR-associated protein Csm5
MKTQTYYCRLKVITPVHIGCDEVYEPTGFALDEQQKELVAFEPASFLGMLEQQDLDKFSVICRKGTVQSLLEIYKFIRQHKEHAQGRRVAVSDAFVAHYSKTLNLPPNAVQQQLNKFQLARTSYQPISGSPYIPGSAVKGALRTAVLNLRNNGKNLPKYRNGKQLNDELAGGTFATDPFRLVKVGDFQASGKVLQKIVYAVNRKKKPSEKEAGGPYQILEVIEKGTKFVGTITIQTPPAGAGIRRPVDMDELQQALGFHSRELEREKISVKSLGCDQVLQFLNPGQSSLIRVGRHSGAECVTVEGHRKIWIKKGGRDGKTLDHATTLWLAAGSDNPSTNKYLQPFGWAEFALLSTEDAEEYEKERAATFSTWEKNQQEVLAAFTAKTEQLARQQEEERQVQEQLAAEQQQREEELRKYPWRTVLPKLAQIADWGALKTRILEQEDFMQYQAEEEVGLAVVETARRVAGAIGKKWTSDRDTVVADWSAVSGATWKPLAAATAAPESTQVNEEQLEQISGLQTWAEYKKSGLKISRLDKQCAQALKEKFSSWKVKKSKDKQQKKAFKDLTKRLKLIA